MAIALRSFRGSDDEPALYAILRDVERGGMHAAELSAHLSDPELDAADVAIATDDGAPIGYAVVSDRVVEIEVAEKPFAGEAREALLEWGVSRLATSSARDRRLVVFASLGGESEDRSLLLRRHGFEAGGMRFTHVERSLSDELGPIDLPPGYVLRPREPRDLDAYVAARRSMPWAGGLTAAYLHNLEQKPGWTAALDLLVESPEGAIAGYANAWIDPTATTQSSPGRRAQLHRVGTCPPFRRLGLARALVWALLHELKARGFAHAFGLVSDLASEAMRMYVLHSGYRKYLVDYHHREVHTGGRHVDQR
jgi:ribosomal protein S18 acetylase RimI-like enzyme